MLLLKGGALTREQKSELIRKVTEVASEIMQIPMEFFLCTVKELPDENIGIGGRTIDLIK
ncbi:4-oxalocrotonate tautomerase [Bacteroides fragilis]|nr:4-oxalocrotonate tautomerase [Bacteroides fragilis]RGM89597.1 4-oxalocrotonate tautomerase [Bacteroides fragilis]RGN15163.1 4-oxalocrotonate tautomerase [Bacteroides fragilis]TWV55381.1 4-oxalocrotonate tautomerase [Bacteroides fragilis]